MAVPDALPLLLPLPFPAAEPLARRESFATPQPAAPPADADQDAAAPSPLANLLSHPGIWRHRKRAAGPSGLGIPTGHPTLDAVLPDGGWPRSGLIELLLPHEGIGELQLLLPTLRRLLGVAEPAAPESPESAVPACLRSATAAAPGASRAQRGPRLAATAAVDQGAAAWRPIPIGQADLSAASAPPRCGNSSKGQSLVLLIDPPHLPYAPAFAAHGLPLSRLLWLGSDSPRAGVWAFEQSLLAGCCAAVLAWLPALAARDYPRLRRLQLAADAGSVPAFLFRPARHAEDASPASLKALLGADRSARWIEILKCRRDFVPRRRWRLP